MSVTFREVAVLVPINPLLCFSPSQEPMVD